MNKEEAYDRRLAPLVAEIIEICKEHKIAMLASWYIPTEEEPDLCCSTALLGGDYDTPESYHVAYRAIRHGGSQSLAMTLTTATTSKEQE